MTNGAAAVSAGQALAAMFAPEAGNVQHLVIREIRLPRIVLAALVGACLAVAGALMQGVTRNPLASPGIMGLTAGAEFALTMGVVLAPGLLGAWSVVLSMVGALLGVAVVFGLGALARDGLTPVKLALAGVTLSLLLSGLTAILVFRARLNQDVALYFAGGFVGSTWGDVVQLAPLGIAGLILGVVLARDVTVLSLGADVAAGLGQRTQTVRLGASIAVVVLVGGAVAVAGPVGFVGLVAPHLARAVLGLDYRWVVPGSAVISGALVTAADLLARSLNPPFELPAGVVTAAIGVPFFLYLARRTRIEL